MQSKGTALEGIRSEFQRKHPDYREWLNIYGLECIVEFAANDYPLGAVANLTNDEAPALGLFYESYQDKAVSWLCMIISELNMFAQAAHKLSKEQIRLLALDIISVHSDLNLAEICIFFARARQGRYGHFYNAVDNVLIMNWLQSFRKERIEEMDRYEKFLQEEKREQDAAAHPTMSLEEYKALCAAKGIKVKNLTQGTMDGLRRQILSGTHYSEKEARELLKEEDAEFIKRRDEMIRKAEQAMQA